MEFGVEHCHFRFALPHKDHASYRRRHLRARLEPVPQNHIELIRIGSIQIGEIQFGGGPRPLTLVDVEDVVDLLLVLADRPEALGQAFFVAGSKALTMEELQDIGARELGVSPRTVKLSPWMLKSLAAAADVITQTTGRKLPLNRKLARQLLAPAWTCSGAKAERLLGFRPRRDLEDSIRRSARWYREQGWL